MEVNQFGIKCWKSNGYKKLLPQEVSETAKYEAIGEHILQLGQRLNFRYLSIKQLSEDVISLLEECLMKYVFEIEQFKYDLGEEVLIVA